MTRKQFEQWISSPPYERSTLRFPNDPERFAWPGGYRDYQVQLAWEAWQEATQQAEKRQRDEQEASR